MPWCRALVLLALPLSLAAAQPTTSSISGTVTDSIRHRPLVGATVVAMRSKGDSANGELNFTATTDARGHYVLTLPADRYAVTVEHPWLDSTGFVVPARTIDLTSLPAAVLNLAVPSGATIRAAFCPMAARDGSVGLVAGYVKDAHSDRAVADARVVFAWTDFDVDPVTARAVSRQRTTAVTTGRDGTFRMCGIPVLRAVLMQAQFGAHEATGAVEVQVPASGVLVETLRLDAGAAAADASTTSAVTLTGEVRRAGSERALAGAHVHLYGASEDVVTGPDGSFRLSGVPLGSQSLEVTALGFQPQRLALDVRAADMDRVSISMIETGIVLDSVKIVGKRTTALSAEFDQRSAHGAGMYITEAMIAKAKPHETAELLQAVNGFQVVNDVVYSARGLTAMSGNRVCQPTVYVDGNKVGNMNDIVPSAIHGIEAYVSSTDVPVKYAAGHCGAILIWTK